jgi:hypothetical protein
MNFAVAVTTLGPNTSANRDLISEFAPSAAMTRSYPGPEDLFWPSRAGEPQVHADLGGALLEQRQPGSLRLASSAASSPPGPPPRTAIRT